MSSLTCALNLSALSTTKTVSSRVAVASRAAFFTGVPCRSKAAPVAPTVRTVQPVRALFGGGAATAGKFYDYTVKAGCSPQSCLARPIWRRVWVWAGAGFCWRCFAAAAAAKATTWACFLLESLAGKAAA